MQKPTFDVVTVKQSLNFGRFAIEPLEKGFGNTLGNALRRVLLSSFQGAAITQVKIEGVTHKFSTLEGLSEDMIDLLLNLKSIKVAYDQEGPALAKLSVKGPKVVTAADIIAPPSVKIVNPDSPIARLSKGAKLEMEIEINTGFGYSPAEDRSSDVLGVIPLDAIFSPIERVSYQIEATRVGRRTDFDKLLMDIYTDGSQPPLALLKEAARILTTYFTQIYDPQLAPSEPASPESTHKPSLSLEELGLPTRILNALKHADFSSVRELTEATDKDLKNVKNLGGKSLQVIDQALQDKGFSRSQ